MIKFTIEGNPCAKGRPRFRRDGRTYTDAKTISYEEQVRVSYLQTERVKYFDHQPLKISIIAYFAIPVSTSKKVKEKMLTGEIRPTKKPDFDNISKIVADSLNAIAYNDDSQIVRGEIDKFYSIEPRVDVEISELLYVAKCA